MNRLDRRAFLSRSALVLAVPAAISAAGCRETRIRPLSPILANFVVSLHPAIERVNEDFRSKSGLLAATPSGDPIDDFLREAEDRTSTWDTYVGMTPWVEMARLVKMNVIEPWDAYIAPDVLQDILPQLREEASLDGRLYAWPFLADVVVQAWNGELVERAGLDPERAPATWDEYLANARTIVRTGVAPYGCTFDPRGWRSLVPIAHSLATDLYTEEGLFDFTHPGSVEALQLMRRMLELSHPNVLDPEAVLASVGPDEAAFAAQTVAYSVKYQNAHVRFASAWRDPARLRLATLPANGGPGGSVHWTIGLALLRYGKRKRDAATYAKALTQDDRVWRHSIGDEPDTVGQLPAFSRRSNPDWTIAPWVRDATDALQTARPIHPHPLGEEQFRASRPFWEEYLRGVERSAPRALKRAMNEVRRKARGVTR